MVTMTMSMWDETTGYFEPGDERPYSTVEAALQEVHAVVRTIDGAELAPRMPFTGGFSLDVLVPSDEFEGGQMVERVFSIRDRV